MEQEAGSPQVGAASRRRHSTSLSQSIIGGLLAAIDVVVVVGLGLAIYSTYVGWRPENSTIYVSAVTIAAFLIVQSFLYARLYKFNRIIEPARQTGKILAICTIVFLAMVTLSFALKISAEFSRIWAFSWLMSATALMIVVRFGFFFLLSSWAREGRLGRNIAVFGGGEDGQKILAYLSQNDEPWNRVVGVFDDRLNRVGSEVAGFPVLGNLDDLIRLSRDNRSDDVLVALPWRAEQRIQEILRRLQVLPANIRLCPDLVTMNFLQRPVSHYYGIPMLNIVDKPMHGWNAVMKQIVDFGLGSLFLLLSSPVLVLIAIAIKLDTPGPVFFRQKRYGLNNQLIEVWKFRTMHIRHQVDEAEKLTVRNDPRVTRVGSILRRTSLDELPQLFNVLRGEMSLVGPRPHALKAKAAGQLYEEAVAQYAVRHKVKPGITGWAQVNGWRGETDTHEKLLKRIEHDLEYINNWSFLLDLRIIAKTLLVVLSTKDTY